MKGASTEGPPARSTRSTAGAKKPEAQTSEPKRRGMFFQPRATGPSPYPPLGRSLARGLSAVGASPAILALAFLGVLCGWAGFAALGVDLSAPAMVFLMGLPPLHAFLDVSLVRVAAESTASATGLILGLGAIRAIMIALLALLVVSAVRDGSPDLRSALRRLPKTAMTMFLLLSVELAAVLTIPFFLQTLLGPQIAFLSTAVLGLHFLVLAPVIAAAEGGPTAGALRRSFRAARLRGPSHLLLVLAYFSFVFWAANVVPGAGPPPATPSILTWGLALLATFVHVGVLGALTFRWFAVRDQVPPTSSKRSAEP